MKYQMRKTSLFIFLALSFLQIYAQTTEDSFKKVWKAHQGNWPKSYTREEHRIRTEYKGSYESISYKAGIYPILFREDFRNLDDGDAVIQVGPNVYNFKKFKQAYKGWPILGVEDLIFGKMYYQSYDSVKKDLQVLRIDISRGRQQIWNSRKVLIFGASHPQDNTTNQIWYDAVEMYPVRWQYDSNSGPVDVQYLNYKNIDGTFFPTERKEYVNSKIRQTTDYLRVQFNLDLDPTIFDPKQFGSSHWIE